MFPLVSLHNVQLLIATLVLLLGFICIMVGIILLISRGYSREVRSLAAHAARLGQKGIAEEMSSLVGSASGLVSAINGLVKTSTGIGVFLIFLGMAMIAGSYWIFVSLEWGVS